MISQDAVGFVVIGRDLGARLDKCLRSIAAPGRPVVYVDSASSDGSEQAALALGVDLVRLDPGIPLSASRGRNAGLARVLSLSPNLEFVQMVDGDCELVPGWIEAGVSAMRGDPALGIVCGHVREKHAKQSVAATLLDIDWQGPVGEIRACGGIFLARASAFYEVGGFSTQMIAGEEAELCARMRGRGWRLSRIDRAMCEHDADMHQIGAWWRRAVRVGHTYAMSAALPEELRDPAMTRRIRSALAWGGVFPLLGLAGAVGAFWTLTSLLVPAGVLGLYAVQVLRVSAKQRRAGWSPRAALLYGTFNLVAKWAQLLGCLRYWTHR